MKKLIVAIIAGAACFAGLSQAQVMEGRQFSVTAIGTNVASQTFVLRGELEAVYVDITATKTQTVAIATAQGTAFSRSITADGLYFPRAQIHDSAGNAQTVVDGGANTNKVFGKFPFAGPVTLTVTPAADTTGTNTTTVTVIYKP